jgi:hypothetical protein
MNDFKSTADKGTPANEAAVGHHGDAVSAVANAPDPTPETNHGADVSAVAKANHGHDVAGGHGPDHHGKPAKPGKSRGHK